MDKAPFNIDTAIERIRKAVLSYPKAAMFELAEDGYNSPFEQLVACIISIRTYDEVSIRLARNLFAVARTPEAIDTMPITEIDRLIAGSTFHERKAVQIHQIARRLVEEFQGKLPCDEGVLFSFGGVGVKCAHLTLGVACLQKWISVDVHVDRVTNRWGYVRTNTPEKTMEALERVLPEAYWVEINQLLVPFGKHICAGERPRCSACPLLDMCQQVGVNSHR